jgi:hypothetical protein
VRTFWFGWLLPLACLAGVAAAQAAVASTQTLVFDGVYSHYKFVNKGPKGDSPGDTKKASGVLHDDSGTTVGTFEFTCVWAKVVKDDVLENCSISITTADGTLNGSGTSHRYSPNPPWPLTGGSGAYAGATGSVLTRDIAGRDEAVTDSVGVVTVTAKHRLKVGVVPRPSANRPFVARADAVCTSSQAKLSTLPPFPVSNFDPGTRIRRRYRRSGISLQSLRGGRSRSSCSTTSSVWGSRPPISRTGPGSCATAPRP